MGRGGALLLVLLTGCVAHPKAPSTALLDPMRAFQGPTGPDVVVMDVALIEKPVGDHYLNQDLWSHADEQVISQERKAVLIENGFRIGQVGGITPTQLQQLLTSERTCPNPRRIQLHAEGATTVLLGPAVPQCRFQVHEEGRPRSVAFDNADCALVVIPSLASEGRIRLHFTPRVQAGAAQLYPRPAADRSGWELQEQRPTESFDFLSWEVVLAPNEYVIVGARYDRPDTLGAQCFVRREAATPTQRLLAIRTSRPAEGVDLSAPAEETAGSAPLRRFLPLAFQASSTGTRGRGN